MGRKPLSPEQREETRRKLFEASNKMIAAGGIENLNIRSLCNEVGIAYSSFYDYYKSKDELIASKSDALDRFFLENEETRLRSNDFFLDLKNFILLYAEFVSAKNIEIIREVFRMQLYGNLSFSDQEERPVRTILTRIVREGAEHKQLPDGISTKDVERLVLSFCRGIVTDWCACSGAYSITDLARSAADILDSLYQAKRAL